MTLIKSEAELEDRGFPLVDRAEQGPDPFEVYR